MKRLTTVPIALGACALMLVLTACGGGTPEERISRTRGMYSARINGFYPQPAAEPEPAIAEGTEEGGEPMEPTAVEGEGEEEMIEEMEPAPPANPDIMLDILIQHDSPEILPGITVDISMADAAGNPKSAWKVYFDTSKVLKANVTPYSHVLEDVPYVEGDGFFAEIRHPVPVEERGEYREFSSAG